MPLTPGTTLGPYEVVAEIGKGGMGEVYRARDTTLDRDVALKVLPQAFTSDPDRLARFEREAKVLASLNHPNIGHIYGLEEADGQKALVLELVEGPTLADRIAQGPIPIDEALPIAKQIAEALEAAHEQGVIHRDLKPANIKVRDDGTVKVLDFGLAKAFQPDASDVSQSMSPTISLTAAATQMGMVVGTAAYMAPEQAKGKVVDKRADVWAFGAVLYEMLSGKKPFVGDDVSDTLALVLKFEPDWDALPADTPARLRQLVQTCLQKNPKQRIHDVADVRLAMEGAFETKASASQAEPGVAPSLHLWQRPIPAVIVTLAIAATAALTVWTLVQPNVDPMDLVRFTIVPPDGAPLDASASARELAISSDGTRLIYRSRSPDGGQPQLALWPLDQFAGALLRGTEGGSAPFFSPDGESVGFQSTRTTIRRVSILGGSPVTVTEAPSIIRGASWGTDDQIIFGSFTGGLFGVAGGGGEAEPVTTLDTEQGEVAHMWPSIIPGRDAVVFAIARGLAVTADLAVLDLGTGNVKRLGLAGISPRYVPTGHLVYAAADQSLRAVRFDVTSLEVTGSPVLLIDEFPIKTTGAADYSVSDNGRLVYALGAGSVVRSVVLVDRQGREEPLAGLEPGGYQSLRVSPDGARLALDLDGERLWTYDIARGAMNPLTTEPGVNDLNPIWSPDGARVVFSRDNKLLWLPADGTGAAEELLSRERVGVLLPESWTPDGRLLFLSVGGQGIADIEALSLEGDRTTEVLIQTTAVEGHPVVSPDGQWIAYHSDVSGRQEIYVERFPALGERQPISTDGGRAPLWSPDGRELFYRSIDGRQVMVVPISTEPTLTAGAPEVLFQGSYVPSIGITRSYDLMPNGQQFVMVKFGTGADEALSSPQIAVILNWHEELKERVPTN